MGSGLLFEMLGVVIILSNKFIILMFSLVTLARLDGIPTLAHENEEIIVKNPCSPSLTFVFIIVIDTTIAP